MSDGTDKQAAEYGRRVYEYVADDGTVYWSFDKHPQTVSPPKRLMLQSRVGKHLINFLNQMRRRGMGQPPDEGGG